MGFARSLSQKITHHLRVRKPIISFFWSLLLYVWHVFYRLIDTILLSAMRIVQMWATLFFSCRVSIGSTNHEYHVSTAQEETKEHARVPRANGNEERPEGSFPASREGTEEALCE
jgi:hypothetical protein